MSPPADPLRNTLDQLALDPSAKDDRKYLVSVLRRLGYSEREIREVLGEARKGEEGRLIEVEYTGTEPAVVGDEVDGEGTFSLVTDEPEFEADEPEFETVEEWDEEWDEGAQEPVETTEETADEDWYDADDAAAEADDAFTEETDALADDPGEPWDEGSWGPSETDEEVVEFIERGTGPDGAWSDEPDEALDEAWADEPAEEPWPEAADEPDQEAEPVRFAVARGRLEHTGPAASSEWEPTQGTAAKPEEDWEPADDWETDDHAVAAGWEPVSPEELEGTQASDEPEGSDDWGRPEEAPGRSWEPVDDDWHETGAWHEEEDTTTPEPSDGPFTLDDYTLYTRDVELSHGNTQPIYFFAKNEPKSGEPTQLPPGYAVERNQRTGLPYLRRADVGGSPARTEAEHDRCAAITRSGNPCKNSPREGSKYCGAHKNWRGPKVA